MTLYTSCTCWSCEADMMEKLSEEYGDEDDVMPVFVVTGSIAEYSQKTRGLLSVPLHEGTAVSLCEDCFDREHTRAALARQTTPIRCGMCGDDLQLEHVRVTRAVVQQAVFTGSGSEEQLVLVATESPSQNRLPDVYVCMECISDVCGHAGLEKILEGA